VRSSRRFTAASHLPFDNRIDDVGDPACFAVGIMCDDATERQPRGKLCVSTKWPIAVTPARFAAAAMRSASMNAISIACAAAGPLPCLNLGALRRTGFDAGRERGASVIPTLSCLLPGYLRV
jgi:hypothetical protein